MTRKPVYKPVPHPDDYQQWIELQWALAAMEAVAAHDDEAYLDALEAARDRKLEADKAKERV